MTSFHRVGLFGLGILAVLLLPIASWAQSPSPEAALTPAQRTAVEAVVQDYLKRNPEAVLDALRTLQERRASAQQQETRQLLKENRVALESDDGAFALGPRGAPVTVVEFFDYRCGYCKQMMPNVLKLIEDKRDVRVVLKELPVLGPDSVTASRAALAALDQDPGKYLPFHRALLSDQRALTDQRLFEIAAEVGLNVPKLRARMDDPSITARIEANQALAERLGFEGTPTFVIGDTVAPGAMDYPMLTKLVDEAAKNCATC